DGLEEIGQPLARFDELLFSSIRRTLGVVRWQGDWPLEVERARMVILPLARGDDASSPVHAMVSFRGTPAEFVLLRVKHDVKNGVQLDKYLSKSNLVF